MRCERGSVCVVLPAGSRFSSDNEGATVWLSLAWTFTARLRRLLRLRVSRVDGLGGSPCDAIGLQRLRQGQTKRASPSWKRLAMRPRGPEALAPLWSAVVLSTPH